MLKRAALVLTATCANMWALSNNADIYPPVIQSLDTKYVYRGDRHGEFVGNDVVVLADGSGWKVHPQDQGKVSNWQYGDMIHISARTDHYWFSRQHHFLLKNDTRRQAVKAMFIQQKTQPTRIVHTEVYYKSRRPRYITELSQKRNKHGEAKTKTKQIFAGYEPSDPRKIIALSDGSIWVIKDHLNDFQGGMNVYVGTQGTADRFYDFVLICGNEREAKWTLARPQK